MDEGYIKFRAQWEKGPALDTALLESLIAGRQRLWEKELIGVYPNGVGYGNISTRYSPDNQFIISGSRTGGLERLNALHFTLVHQVVVAENTVFCTGPIVASSESMSHYAIYENCPWVKFVVHVHHMELWDSLLHKVPTTDRSAPYGTPEMVKAIQKLFDETALAVEHLFVMEGHESGIFAFGSDMEEVVSRLIKLLGTL